MKANDKWYRESPAQCRFCPDRNPGWMSGPELVFPSTIYGLPSTVSNPGLFFSVVVAIQTAAASVLVWEMETWTERARNARRREGEEGIADGLAENSREISRSARGNEWATARQTARLAANLPASEMGFPERSSRVVKESSITPLRRSRRISSTATIVREERITAWERPERRSRRVYPCDR